MLAEEDLGERAHFIHHQYSAQNFAQNLKTAFPRFSVGKAAE